ncbi:membrane dipeptidase [Algibacter mikhailovii]|uniref:membrane dipeptidase n=1 Tax=Algibacter mikhailovii TaxID=425498 RepID=UPI0024957B74|nr:membrane dipeptidase [Algibacter mikhailovii]
MIQFQFADLHCHPTLKAFGKSHNSKNGKAHVQKMFIQKQPNVISLFLQKLLGVTKFTQSDLMTMTNGNVTLAFVSLYPFEKGFFYNRYLNNKLVAFLANIITSVGYKRIRCIQRHKNYFEDLLREYEFLIEALKKQKLNRASPCWRLLSRNEKLEANNLYVIPTIEGAHVLNTGLAPFGVKTKKYEVLKNIAKLKKIPFPPLFITLAHNFNNDLCGHAESLEVLGNLLNQTENLNEGISALGFEVIKNLLDNQNNNTIYIDVKHMSVTSRKMYYAYLEREHQNKVPVIVSHGAVTGTSFLGKNGSSISSSYFASEDINFYDEEIVLIAQTKGLFGVQFDAKRLAPKQMIKKPLFNSTSKEQLEHSVRIIWNQLQHIAEVLDTNGYYSWGIATIGSDFDGTINPLNEIWTAKEFNSMANQLLILVEEYLTNENVLTQKRNFQESPLVIVRRFTYENAYKFLEHFYL